MKLIPTALTVAAIMFANSAFSADPADLQKLKDTGACVKCNLSGADLSGAGLSGANLMFANLELANLRNANLTGAFLRGANLEGANLASADLTGAFMRGTYMVEVLLCNTIMPDGSVIYSGC
tara:strand:- start:148 stop:513 length:366 start_codon:yes stop_codon:yes gene_type:complete